MGTLGIPIWITEMDIQVQDVARRAVAYNDMLQLIYSHPAVEGIILWDFHNTRGASLVDGEDYVVSKIMISDVIQ